MKKYFYVTMFYFATQLLCINILYSNCTDDSLFTTQNRDYIGYEINGITLTEYCESEEIPGSNHIRVTSFGIPTQISQDTVELFFKQMLETILFRRGYNSTPTIVTVEIPSCWSERDSIGTYASDINNDYTSSGYTPCDYSDCCIMQFSIVQDSVTQKISIVSKSLLQSGGSCTTLPEDPEVDCFTFCDVYDDIAGDLDPFEHLPCMEACGGIPEIIDGETNQIIEYDDGFGNIIQLRPIYEISKCTDGSYKISLNGMNLVSVIKGSFSSVDQKDLTQFLMEYAIEKYTSNSSSSFEVEFILPCMTATPTGYELCDPVSCCTYVFDITNNFKWPFGFHTKEIDDVTSNCESQGTSNPDETDFVLDIDIDPNRNTEFDYTNTEYLEQPIDPLQRSDTNKVGNLKGELRVTPNGAAVYTVPIFVAPGTNGHQPNVSVSYNSQASNGQIGWGWNLSASSSIKRVGKNKYYDSGNLEMQFNPFDKLTLDGTRLIVSEGAEGTPSVVYKLVNDNTSRIIPMNITPSGFEWFKVEKSDGTIIEYGKTEDSRSTLKDGTITWFMNKVTDLHGNYTEYNYKKSKGEIALHFIEYAGNSSTSLDPYARIVFDYSYRLDKNKHWFLGNLMNSELLLKGIDIKVKDQGVFQDVRRYEFNYLFEHYSKLHQIIEIGSNGERLNSLLFDHHEFYDSQDLVSDRRVLVNDLNLVNNDDRYYIFGDYNGDGTKDRIIIERDYLQNADDARYHLQYGEYSSCTACDYDFEDPSFGTIIFTTKDGQKYHNKLLRKWIYSGDINSDGYDDLIIPMYEQTISSNNQGDFYDHAHNYKTIRFKFYISDGQKPVYQASYNGGDILMNLYEWDNNNDQDRVDVITDIKYADFNDDGTIDIVPIGYVQKLQSDFFGIYKSPAGSEPYHFSFIDFMDESTWTFKSAPTILRRSKITSIPSTYPATALVGRFNSNSKVDILLAPGHYGGKVYELSGTVFSPQTNYSLIVTSIGNTEVGDFNGDGLTDLVQFDYYPEERWVIRYNTGNGFTDKFDMVANINNSDKYLTNASKNDWDGQHRRFHFVFDVNKDGKDDFIEYWNDANYYSDTQTPPAINYYIQGHMQVYYSRGYSEQYNDKQYFESKKVVFPSQILEYVPGPYYFTLANFYLNYRVDESEDHGSRYWNNFYLDDFNGDGNLDIYQKNKKYDHIISFTRDEHANDLHIITESQNNVIEIDYKKIDEGNINGLYERGFGAQYPLRNLNRGLSVVSQVLYKVPEDPDVSLKTYSYSKAIGHYNKGLLGFEKFEEVQTFFENSSFPSADASRTIVESIYEVDDQNIIHNSKKLFDFELVSKEVTIDNNFMSNQQSFTTYDYSFNLLNDGVFLKYPNVITTTNSLLNTEKKVEVTLDNYGNQTYEKESVKDLNTSNVVTYNETTNNFIKHDPQGHWDNLLSTSTTTNYHIDDSPNLFKLKTSFFYNDSNNDYLLTSKSSEDLNHTNPNEDVVVTETYTYDDYGNVLTVTKSAIDPLYPIGSRTLTNIFDNSGRFKTNTINSLGQSSSKQYDLIGGVIKKIKHNGNIELYSFDGFGNLISQTDKFGTISSIDSRWIIDHPNANNYPSDISYYIVTKATNISSPKTLKFYNSRNKLRRSETEMMTENGLKKIWVDYEYYESGALKSKTDPYFSDLSPIRITKNYYREVYNQISKIEYQEMGGQNSIVTTYDYDLTNRETTVTDPELITSSKITDAAGNLIESEDGLGNNVYFEYASNSEMKEVITVLKDGLNNEEINVTIEYDNFGRKKVLNDPDAGQSTYKYNAYGELIEQTNPNGTENRTYDNLGRLSTILQYDDNSNLVNTINYNYVSSGYGIGNIYTIADNNSTTTHTYNIDGQLSTKSEVISEYLDGSNNQIIPPQTFNNTYVYDSQGRLERETLISGHEIKYNYNQTLGFLEEIRIHNGNRLWKYRDIDRWGNITKFERGNWLIVNENTYDDLGRLTRVNSYKKNSSPVVTLADQSYVFDLKTSNLDSRTDNKYSLTETFNYDNLYRLDDYSYNSTTIDMDYFKDGSIKTKTGIGNYVYSNTDNHATTGLKFSTITENGNNIVLKDKDLTYNNYNSVKSITQDDDFIDFEYRHDGNRISQHSFDLNTNSHIKSKYFSSDYEKVFYSNGDIKEISYVPFTNGQVVLVKITGGTSPSSLPSSDKVYYPTYDYLGSLTSIANDDLSIIENYSYDPWGRLRDVTNYNNLLSETNFTYFNLLDRGFTGHEHLPTFKLINMNGRVYDPILGQFIQPDNNITFPENSNGYNRYTYAMNNPLKFTDPNGEIPILFGYAIFAGLSNAIVNSQDISNGWDFAGYFGVGALSTLASAGVGAGINGALSMKSSFSSGFMSVFSSSGPAQAQAIGFIQTAYIGAGSGAASGFLMGFGNAGMRGENFGGMLKAGAESGLYSAGISGLISGLFGGIKALKMNKDFWTGNVEIHHPKGDLIAVRGSFNPDYEAIGIKYRDDGYQLYNDFNNEKDVYYMLEDGTFGTNNKLKPGEAIKERVDAISTVKHSDKIFKVPGGTRNVPILGSMTVDNAFAHVTKGGEVTLYFQTEPGFLGVVSQKRIAMLARALTNNSFGWLSRDYFINNGFWGDNWEGLFKVAASAR